MDLATVGPLRLVIVSVEPAQAGLASVLAKVVAECGGPRNTPGLSTITGWPVRCAGGRVSNCRLETLKLVCTGCLPNDYATLLIFVCPSSGTLDDRTRTAVSRSPGTLRRLRQLMALTPAASARGRSLMPARHVAETLQRHQRDADVACGRQVEEAGATAVIDSAHQEDQDDQPGPTGSDPSPEKHDAEHADMVTASGPDSKAEQRAPAEVPAGLARIRTAAANATSALFGVTRAVGGARGTSKTDAVAAEHDSDKDDTNRGGPETGAQACHAAITRLPPSWPFLLKGDAMM